MTVANLDKLVLPATLEVVYADGSKQDLRVPVETWLAAPELRDPGERRQTGGIRHPGSGSCPAGRKSGE